ncbi:phosphoribosylglycinamide formyltransferase [soil metagenome]
MRVVVLVSGSGSNLQALLDAPAVGPLVRLVVSDRPGAGGLARGRSAGVPAECVDLATHPDRARWEARLRDVVATARPDLVVLAGFMRVLSPAFVERWPVVNVHPSLLPAFPGAHAVADALAHGVRVTGVTVHFVDEQVDHGPIIAQQAVAVRPDDTVASLHARIQAVEHRLLPRCVELFAAGRLSVHGRHVRTLP